VLCTLATPAGVAVGAVLPAGGEGGALIASGFEAMAGGSFTFVALLETLPRELHAYSAGVSQAAKLAMLALGFAGMAALASIV
jgi:hypothetical protein